MLQEIDATNNPIFNKVVGITCCESKRSQKVALHDLHLKPLGANPTQWFKTLKQFVGNLPTNCLSVFDHFVGWRLKG